MSTISQQFAATFKIVSMIREPPINLYTLQPIRWNTTIFGSSLSNRNTRKT